MTTHSDNAWLERRFSAVQRYAAEHPGGFVCILDLRVSHAETRPFSLGPWLEWAALSALAVFAVCDWISSQSESATHPGGGPVQFAESTFPSDLPTTPQQ